MMMLTRLNVLVMEYDSESMRNIAYPSMQCDKRTE